jgi:Rifampin ADP-ribosyl transferase
MTDVPGAGPFYHGCKADLKTGDLLIPGYLTNYGTGRTSNFIYFSATLDAATWGAELARSDPAKGDTPGRIYIVEPTGPSENDPNLTERKFPGNPTRSYRSRDPLRIVGEVTGWTGHPPEQVQAMKDHVACLREQGIVAEDD